MSSLAQRAFGTTSTLSGEAVVPEINTPKVGFKIRPLRELWFEESLPASLYQYFTGNTKQRQAEEAKKKLKTLDPKSEEFQEQLRIYNKFSYLTKDNGTFDVSEVAKFIASNPSFLASELVNAAIADPYLFLIPTAWGKIGALAVKATGAVTKTQKRLARAGALAASGAALGTLYSVPIQLGEDAELGLGRTLAEASVAGTANLAFGAMFGGLSSKLAKETEQDTSKVAAIVEKKLNENPKDLEKATNEVIDEVLAASKMDADITDEVKIMMRTQFKDDVDRIRNATILKEFNWKVAGSLGGVGAVAGFLTAKDEKLEAAAGMGITMASVPLVIKGIRKLVDKETDEVKISRARNQLVAKELTYKMMSNVENINNKVRQFSALRMLVPEPIKREAMVFAMQEPHLIAKDGTFTFDKFNKSLMQDALGRFQQNKNELLRTMLPDEAERIARINLNNFLDNNLQKATVKFTPQEMALIKEDGLLHKVHAGLFDQIKGSSSKKLTAVRNYVLQEWERGPGEATFGKADQVLKGTFTDDVGQVRPLVDLFGMTGGFGGRTKKRLIPNYRQGIHMGFIPRSNDAGEIDIFDIMTRYQIGVGKALMERRTIDKLRSFKIDGGITPAVVANINDVPASLQSKFKQFDHPVLNQANYPKKQLKDGRIVPDYNQPPENFSKSWVHEDFLPYIQQVMDAKDPNAFLKHSQNLNFFMKRFAVGASFFHAASLLESVFFTFGPFKGIKPAGQFTKEMFSKEKGMMLKAAEDPNHPEFKKFMETNYQSTLKRLQDSEYSDVINLLVRNGLTINTPEDVGFDTFYAIFNRIEDSVAKIPALGKVMNDMGVRPGRKVFRWFDKITWERGFTNMKLYTGIAKLNQLIKENPSVPLTQLARDAGEFANDAYGGQNWARLANEVADPMLRTMAQEAFKPSARPYVQLAMFAPDWTISNIRIAARAIPAFNANERNRNLYGMYLINGAILYATLANAVNYAFSGHSILENRDPTRIDLGNGEVLTFSKQYMEPFHWITDPQKTGLKKMGSLAKTVGEVMTNKQYLTTGWSPQITKKDYSAIEKALAIGGQVGQKFLPIWVNQAVEEYMEDGLTYDDALNVILGQMGHPKYKAPRTSSFNTRGLTTDPMKVLF